MRHGIAAVIIGLFAVACAFADTSAPATRPGTNADQDELLRPGSILVARWNALLDHQSAASIEALGTAQQSESRVYQAMTMSASALRNALAEARSRKGVLATGSTVDFGKSESGDNQLKIGQPLAVQLVVRTPRRITLQSDWSGFDAFDPTDRNSVHIVLKHANLGLQLSEEPQKPNAATEPSEQSIMYDGRLKPGEALAFLGTFTDASGTNYHHLVVWEAFRAEGWEAPNIGREGSGISAEWWIKYGPAKLRALADVAAVWASRAKHAPDDPPAAYSVVLDNGAGARLLGFCEPSNYNFCWWDPAGNPIDAPMHMGLQSFGLRRPYTYAIEIRGSTTEPETPLPPANGKKAAADWKLTIAGFRPSDRIETILGVGPWKDVGELNQDQSLTVDNVTYNMATMGGVRFKYARLQRNVSSNDRMTLSLVSDDGNEIGPDWTDNGPKGAEVGFSRLPQSGVKMFHLWLRKGHVVTFADFALSPNVRPPIAVTRDEVLAAIKNPQPLR
jgi:hypothetical protein